jgi:hypothetical protein
MEALLSTARIAASLGYSYGTDRDLYQALGYVGQSDLNYDKYVAQYTRQDLAKAVINRPVNATWSGELSLFESSDVEETRLEEAWKDLDNKLALRSKFARVDKLTGLGKYGVLLLGFDDVSDKEGFKRPVSSGDRELLYVKPLGESSATIEEYELNTNNERYGLPSLYKVITKDPKGGSETNVFVHWTRVIHVAGDLLESETEGTPRLESIFNRLKDVEKIVGGSAEMFWRGARPGYASEVNPDFTLTEENEDALQDQLDEYEHNLRRILVLTGMKLNPLAPQVSDPLPSLNAQIQMISADTGIPMRVLLGSERGELASTQDRSSWLEAIQSRRKEFAEPCIVIPFVERCIQCGVLPEAGKNGYTIEWSDLWAMSDKDKAEVGRARAEALRAYGAAGPAMDAVPPRAFYELFLGLKQGEIDLINKFREIALADEDNELLNPDEEKIEGAAIGAAGGGTGTEEDEAELTGR